MWFNFDEATISCILTGIFMLVLLQIILKPKKRR